MSYNEKDILEDDEIDDHIKALDDSDVDDVDDVEEDLKRVGYAESEEYSDDDAIYQSNQILQTSKNTNSSFTDNKKELIKSRAEESEEYSDDENIYPSKVTTTTESGSAKKVSGEQWAFVSEETDYRPKRLPDFIEPSGPTFTLPSNPAPVDFYSIMLPDSLFNHIAECTNIRAKLHFTNILTNKDNSWREVE